VNEPELFNVLRDRGVDADDPDIRAAVRHVFTFIREARQRGGPEVARRCMEGMREALTCQLEHPDVADMTSFEAEFGDDEP
jgi:hypothetical protein